MLAVFVQSAQLSEHQGAGIARFANDVSTDLITTVRGLTIA
jgi:hypothetical protein